MTNREPLRRIAWLLLLLAVLFAADRLGGRALESLLMSSEFRYSLLYGGRAQAEVVILGNSRSVNSFYQPGVERAIQKKTLSLGYNGLSTTLVHALALDQFELSDPPRLLVLETTILSAEMATQSLIENFKPYTLRSQRLLALLQEEAPSDALTCRLSRLYCFNSEMFIRALYFLGHGDQGWINRYRISQSMLDSVEEMPPFDLDYTDDAMTLLVDLIDRAQQQNVRVRLILGPFLPAYAERIANLPEYVSVIEAKTGLKLWNYAAAVDEIDAFADRVHLNQHGSELLLERLVQDGFFEL